MRFITAFWTLYFSGVLALLIFGILHTLFDRGGLLTRPNLWRLHYAWITLFWPIAPFFYKSRIAMRIFTNTNF